MAPSLRTALVAIATVAVLIVATQATPGATTAHPGEHAHAHAWHIVDDDGVTGIVAAIVADGEEIDDEAIAEQLASRTGGEAVAGEVAFRWAERGGSWTYNPDGGPAGAADWFATLEDVADGWTEAAGGAWTFGEPALSDARPGACDLDGDGENTVGWAPLPEGVLGYTCVLFAPGEDEPRKAVEFDILLNSEPSDGEWTTAVFGGDFDLASIAAHEFGHAIGLDHEGPCPGAVMCATYTPGSVIRAPQAADVEQVRALYGERVALSSTLALSLPAGTTRVPWTETTASAAEVMAAGGGALEAIYGWDEELQTWERYLAGAPDYVNTLETLEAGTEYWFVARAPLTIEP